MTQMHFARASQISPEMHIVAEDEGLDPERVRAEVAAGRMIIPANVHHPDLEPIGIGVACRCKINANIGNSPAGSDVETELQKLDISLRFGADTVMDLSTGEHINEIRQAIIARSPAPVGTVPIYEALVRIPAPEDLTPDLLLEVIAGQAEQGVDFMTIHAGILLEHLPMTARRVTGIVSRGGAALAKWMLAHHEQNPLYTHFDKILDIARRCDVTLSLGDGLRPGCLADANDAAQFAELGVLGELTLRAWERDVQVMIEGPGHVPLDKIALNVKKQAALCHGAPFYVLGPLVTDVAAGHDHIASAIGGAIAAWSGAALLCYVTPREHLGLPNLDDVKEGVIAHKIAAHAADIARGRRGARDRDDAMSRARFDFDWEKQFALALDPEKPRVMHDSAVGADESFRAAPYCTMCGEKFCSLRASHDLRQKMEGDENVNQEKTRNYPTPSDRPSGDSESQVEWGGISLPAMIADRATMQVSAINRFREHVQRGLLWDEEPVKDWWARGLFEEAADLAYEIEQIAKIPDEFSIVALYRIVEFNTRLILRHVFGGAPEKWKEIEGNLYRWKWLKGFLKQEKGVDLDQVPYYGAVDELLRLNNGVKHSWDVSGREVTQYRKDLCAAYERLSPCVSKYIEALAEAVKATL